jgi:hypothetical protein
MGSKNYIYKGMEWAFTEEAKIKIIELTSVGLEYDLAVGLINKAIDDGLLTENEIYHIPTDSSDPSVK